MSLKVFVMERTTQFVHDRQTMSVFCMDITTRKYLGGTMSQPHVLVTFFAYAYRFVVIDSHVDFRLWNFEKSRCGHWQ
jgi:hypothetical protein